MNKYIRKLGFRSSDELEMRVTIKAIKYSWIYMMAFLAGWAVVQAMDGTGEIPMVQISLILTAELCYFALQWIFTKKAVRENQEMHSNSKRLTSKGKGKNSYEYVYEDDDGNQYVYEEVEVEE
ncbi:MAG: hypothetical protein II685_03725 [Clostridia bacterium]|nr:hypothetical protein [Clostridia bacterium]